MQRGMIPVIVHPERNTHSDEASGVAYQMIERGAFAQVTASSYVGTFGKKVQQFSEDIIDAGLAHVFGSNTHRQVDYEMSDPFDPASVVRRRHTFLKKMPHLLTGIRWCVLMSIKLKSGFCHGIRRLGCLPMKIVLKNFSTLVA